VVLRPVGPLSPGVYWFRRLLIAGVVVLVLALVWWLFFRGDDGTAATSGTPTSTPTPTAAVTPSETATKTPKPNKTETTAPAARLCADDAIEVTVATDEEQYPADVQPTFTLTVTNVSGKVCRRDVGQSALELRVSSGGTLVWSSDDCNPGGAVREQTLEPGDRFVQSVQWARATSEEGCPTPADSAEPGQYQVVARDLEIYSEPAVFQLQ